MSKVNTQLVMVLLVVILSTNTLPTTSAINWKFPFCYAKCLPTCLITYPIPVCATKCVNDCLHHRPLSLENVETYSCTLECVTSKCTNISTKTEPRKFHSCLFFFYVF